MKVLTEEEMASRLDFVRSLHPSPDPPDSVWCIPFEFGGVAKGTRISIAKAREIAAELRASIAEAEMRLLRRAFDDERKRSAALADQYSAATAETFAARAEAAALKQKLRRKSAHTKGT